MSAIDIATVAAPNVPEVGNAPKVEKAPKAEKAPKTEKTLKVLPDGTKIVKVKPRAKNGAKALREMRFEQKSAHQKAVFPRASFKALVYEIAKEATDNAPSATKITGVRMKRSAVDALQEARLGVL